MLKLHIPESGEERLFEATFEPVTPSTEKLARDTGLGEGEITTIQGKTNKIVVGLPYYENLISRLVTQKEEIPHEIKEMMDDYDFHYVSLSCSFLPDPDCRFVWARFGIELNAVLESGRKVVERPIAFDMAPSEILSETKYMREVNINPEGKLSLSAVNLDMRGMSIKTQKELIIHEPQVFASGFGYSTISWDFKSTKEKGIWGNKVGLLLIVKTPKKSKVKGKFLLGAEVEYKLKRWIPVPLSKRIDKVVDAEYDLSK